MATARLAGGCFWCLEAAFSRLRGVTAVQSGYCGGHVADPDYRAVCSGSTGHAETVRIDYDPDIIGFDTLLAVFFTIHDPTTPDRQGHDVGTQYRSAVFWLDAGQRTAAEAFVARLTADDVFAAPIVTRIEPAGPFYPAEAEHHDYYRLHSGAPYCQAVIAPKLAKLRQHFAPWLDQ